MTNIEIKVKDRNCWAIEEGYLELGKWYKARYYNGDLLVISPEDNHTGYSVYIFDHFVDVREVVKLEVGKKYVTKGGVVVGPMVKSDRGWVDQSGNKDEFEDDRDCVYSGNGRFIYSNEEDDENIVSEYKESEIFGKIPDVLILDDISHINEVEVDNFNKTFEFYLDEVVKQYKHNPVEEVTVKRLKAGTYGRLKLSTDGYHAINISVVDGGRTWSKDDLEQAIETLTKIKDAR